MADMPPSTFMAIPKATSLGIESPCGLSVSSATMGSEQSSAAAPESGSAEESSRGAAAQQAPLSDLLHSALTETAPAAITHHELPVPLQLSRDVQAFVLHNVLSKPECEAIIAAAEQSGAGALNASQCCKGIR